MLTLEKEIEKAFCDWIWSRKGKTIKFTDPSQKGAPDRIVFDEHKVYFVEFKRPTGITTKHQIHYAKELDDLDIKVFLIDSFEKLKIFKRTYKGTLLLDAV